MIFSDNFTVREKYSLQKREHICTYSLMPWSCTSLYDAAYKPQLNSQIASKINSIFTYRYIIASSTIKDEEKYLGINHVGDEILSYHAVFNFNYSCLVDEVNWNHFVSSANIPKIKNCRETLELLTSATDLYATTLIGVDYDVSGEEKVIYSYDTTYNLDEYTHNPMICDLNDYCKRNYRFAQGVIGVHTDSPKITFKLDLIYPYLVGDCNYDDESLYKSSNFRVSEFQASERHLYGLKECKLLSDENVDYICNDILKDFDGKNYKFRLEYIFDEEGKLEDIIFVRSLYEEFKEIEKPLS